MVQISIIDELVGKMVDAADKVFKDEWGDFHHYDLRAAKDYFRTCMDVVEETVDKNFPESLDYFRFLKGTKLNSYFGGKKSE